MKSVRYGAQTLILAALGAMTVAGHTQETNYPKPKHLGDPATLGKNIQRTMTLLKTSTPQKRNTVKILFYGQSITEGKWWQTVAADLKRRYPHANLYIENRALGGFSSQLLVKTAETDLYPFYPDLMIFHVYGAHNSYEEIIRRTRNRTTAEILIQTDHVTQDADLNEETDPAKLRPDGKIWNSFMNYLHLPTVAKTYGTGLEDQRNLWKQYLKDTHVSAPKLLSDAVHPNDWGNFVMAEFANAALAERSDTKIDPMNCDTVKTYTAGKDLKWKDGKISLTFEGNRVDLIANGAITQPAEIRIDGKKPSEIPELYGFTHALSTPGGKWAVILKIGSQKPLILEEWTMDVTKEAGSEKLFNFTVRGSKTGEDGSGRSDQPFVSKSGRILIDPEDWNVEYSLALSGIKPIPEKLVVRWSVVPHFRDTFAPESSKDLTVENVVTVAQGLSNGKHTLEIIGNTQTPLEAIRVYRPPFVAK